MHAPFLAHPLGWLVVGAVGFLLYQSGKNAGKKEVEKKQDPKKDE